MEKKELIERMLAAPIKVEVFLSHFEDAHEAVDFLRDLVTFRTVKDVLPAWGQEGSGLFRASVVANKKDDKIQFDIGGFLEWHYLDYSDGKAWPMAQPIRMMPDDYIEVVPWQSVEDLLNLYPNGFYISASGDHHKIITASSSFAALAKNVPGKGNQGYLVVEPVTTWVPEFRENPDPEANRRQHNNRARRMAHNFDEEGIRAV